jgi:hypothetical protein
MNLKMNMAPVGALAARQAGRGGSVGPADGGVSMSEKGRFWINEPILAILQKTLQLAYNK